jgi:L-histidine N-alpha-methyltransferase
MSQSSIAKHDSAIGAAEFLDDVSRGLTGDGQKTLPSQYLYDRVGSALFEVITLLPEYGLTRADERLLETYSGELGNYFQTTPVVAELGSGIGTKTRRILEAFDPGEEILYFPIDISIPALARCKADLAHLEAVRVDTLAHSYIDGLQEAVKRTPEQKPLLLLFLGSTIGNFDRPVAREFLSGIRRILRPDDVLLLGTDLEKPIPKLLAAYDDAAGVTAAFNRNVLSRINRDLDGRFDLNRFRHLARWDENERRIEMHLESREDQEVRIEAADLTVRFRQGETIRTESSHKFNCEEVVGMGQDSGFRCVAQWRDQEWPFAESVLVAE